MYLYSDIHPCNFPNRVICQEPAVLFLGTGALYAGSVQGRYDHQLLCAGCELGDTHLSQFSAETVTLFICNSNTQWFVTLLPPGSTEPPMATPGSEASQMPLGYLADASKMLPRSFPDVFRVSRSLQVPADASQVSRRSLPDVSVNPPEASQVPPDHDSSETLTPYPPPGSLWFSSVIPGSPSRGKPENT